MKKRIIVLDIDETIIFSSLYPKINKAQLHERGLILDKLQDSSSASVLSSNSYKVSRGNTYYEAFWFYVIGKERWKTIFSTLFASSNYTLIILTQSVYAVNEIKKALAELLFRDSPYEYEKLMSLLCFNRKGMARLLNVQQPCLVPKVFIVKYLCQSSHARWKDFSKEAEIILLDNKDEECAQALKYNMKYIQVGQPGWIEAVNKLFQLSLPKSGEHYAVDDWNKLELKVTNCEAQTINQQLIARTNYYHEEGEKYVHEQEHLEINVLLQQQTGSEQASNQLKKKTKSLCECMIAVLAICFTKTDAAVVEH